MTGSDARKANSSARLSTSLGRSKALLAICGILALGLVAGLPATSAQAQFRGFWAPDDDGYPPPIPPRDIGHRREAWAPPPYVEEERPQRMERAPEMERMPIPISELRHRATLAGLKLLGTPHRRGDLYVGFGEDSHGAIHHLTFDAYEGRIVENEVSTTAAKTAPAKPATPPPTAAVTPAKPRSPAATGVPAKAAALPKPAAAPPAATATTHSASPAQIEPAVKAAKDKYEPAPSVTADEDDLTPIRPKPGEHEKLPDNEIDKD
jgi:hypothetical protein